MGSDAVIYVPSFIKIGSGVQKLKEEYTDTHTRGQQRHLISLLYFFKIRKVAQRILLIFGINTWYIFFFFKVRFFPEIRERGQTSLSLLASMPGGYRACKP
jgi:hypothetical protein